MKDHLKCYYGNYDGIRNGLVIANNQKVAAEIASCSVYHFRNYWQSITWPENFTPEPFVLYTRWMDDSGKWTKGIIN